MHMTELRGEVLAFQTSRQSHWNTLSDFDYVWHTDTLRKHLKIIGTKASMIVCQCYFK